MIKPYIGQIKPFPYHPDRTLQGWLLCDGQLLPVSEHEMLFGVIGYDFGGSGNEFGLPRIPPWSFDDPLPGSRYFIAEEGVPPIRA